MFLTIRVGDAALHAPRFFAAAIDEPRTAAHSVNVSSGFGSVDHISVVPLGPRDLPAHERANSVARICVVDRNVIPHFTVLGASESSSRTVGGFGRGSHHPIDGVDVMNRLLGNLVIRQPDEVHPVVQLVLRITDAFFTILVPNATGAVASRGADDLTDLAIVNSLDCFDIVDLAAVLCASHNRRPLLDRFVMSFHTNTETGGVYARWLFGKNVLSGGNRLGDVVRTETRRRGQNDQVDIGIFEHFFVSVQTDVDTIVLDVNLFAMSLAQNCASSLAIFLLQIGHCHQANVVVDRKRVVESSGASSAYPNDSNSDDAIRIV